MKPFELKRNWENFFLYSFGFILLWEWIRPLKKLTDTGHLNVFLFFIFFSFVLSFLKARIWMSFPIKVFYILNCVYVFYFENGFFSSKWIVELLGDFFENTAFVLNGEWGELSNVFRTILFFLLLWSMTYLLQYWLLNRKQIFLFFVTTLIYITVLDTFTPYTAKGAIIRVIVTGFAAMGILTFQRILAKEKVGRNVSFSKKWLTVLSGLIMISVSIGLIAPKAEPIWPDPVPFIKSMNEDSGGGTQRIGYGVDDSQLGGPFIGDNRVVFKAEVETKHYWKVETKDLYTGKGWVVSDNQVVRRIIPPNSEVPIYEYEGDVEVRERGATIYPYIYYPHIVYPFGVRNIVTGGGQFLEMDPLSEKIYFQGEEKNNRAYAFTYYVPTYSVSKLQGIQSSEQARLDPYFVNRYTQVPNDLPPEVKELALEITQGEETWFDKAKAIEKYFDRSIFSYSQKNVAVPGRNDDYVAQFLFETKIGYCDNFSTSMAILLRTLGIPTRWVKGYTAGEYKQLSASGQKVYEVTNNNAHSWLEVYFPGSGWLAFEPTPGFTNNVSLNFDTYKEDTPKNETPIPEKKADPVKPDLKDDGVKKNTPTFSFKILWLKMKLFLNREWKSLFFGGSAIAILSFILYRKRASWMPHYLILKFKYQKKDECFGIAYLSLLKQLELYGLKRKPNQTLRDYAKYVDSFFSTKSMTRLTERYEVLLYKGTLKSGSWTESKELWENLIKKTIA